jgi:hypothetical protein
VAQPLLNVFQKIGVEDKPTAVATCVTPSVPFPFGKTITRIDLTVIVNGKDAGLCGPDFHVGSDNQVIVPAGNQFHTCGAMFGRGRDVPFTNCAFSNPIIANNQVTVAFANWAGDSRHAVIRVYYK